MTEPVEEDGWFSDHVRVVGWIVLHCGIEDAREFLRMPNGKERALVIAAIRAADEHRQNEADYLAQRLAEAFGGE